MARSIELSENEILEALRTARKRTDPDPPGVFLISEFAKKTKKSPRTIRDQVRALAARGLIETVKVWREGSDGRQAPLTAYRILREPR